ncbi:MAG: hypothetical protein Q4A84_07365 [Neisseria sp.]|uniref:hypothetical protein n=1 Tax=Neisseria sp. TaxID=192066 RepID=UPI0026DCBF42|nr:hypothetical protein [Neisseria sp.]MDO4641502.1 hypothetical protein [Neisseria sp.]
MTPEQTLQTIRTLNAKIARKFKVPACMMQMYQAGSLPEEEDLPDAYYLIDSRGIVLMQNGIRQAEYRLGQQPLINFFLYHCPDDKRRQTAIMLTSSPLFWRLKSTLEIPAGTLPIGHLLQTAVSSAALFALALTWLTMRSVPPESKPVGIYMSICFMLALSSIARLGDWWDDERAGIRMGTDYARRLGLLLSALVPFYYYANVTHSILEKPLQYTLLSTTAAAVCMSFLNNHH